MTIESALAQLLPFLDGHKEVYPGQHLDVVALVNAPGCDICEHVPTLIKFGKKVQHITEMGVRYGWSTRSFLFAEPKTLTSIDLFEWNSSHQSGGQGPLTTGTGNSQYLKYKELYSKIVDHQYVQGNTMKIPIIEPTDLLFIDAFHHRDSLKVELARHGNQARRYIILHDTETYGECGQDDVSNTFIDFVATTEPGTGLWYAINPWLKANPHWKIIEHHRNNNGLTVLERLA